METTYLPEVRGILVYPPSSPGKWELRDDLLQKLAKDLLGNSGTCTSIPSLWARALLFAEALKEDDHPQHKEVTDEWRGLMGIFCFRECFGLRLECKSIDFNNIKDTRFRRCVMLQKPNTWPNTIHIIKIDGSLVGGSSPETLYFTPPEYKCSNFVPWYSQDKGKLYDPLSYFKNERIAFDKELIILKKWIIEIKNLLTTCGSTVLGAFNEWLNDMKDIVNSSAKIKIVHSPIKGSMPPSPYDFISSCYSWANEQYSDFFLNVAKTYRDKPPIVIWETTCNQRQKRLFNSWHYGNLKDDVPDKAKGDSLCDTRISYPWIRPEKLFLTDNILCLSGISQKYAYANNTSDILKSRYVPPLRKEILNYLSQKDLKGSLYMEEVEGGGIMVTLRLPLATKDYVDISKTYNQGQIIHLDDRLLKPFEVWPSFKRSGWDIYYCYYNEEIEALDLQPVVYGHGLADADQVSKISIESPEFPADLSTYFRIQGSPEAILCSYKDREAGMILLNSDQEIDSAGTNWDVAIDLGTVNTVVFIKDNDGNIAPFQFNLSGLLSPNSVLQVDDSLRKVSLNKFFFWPEIPPEGIFATSFIKLTLRSGTLNPVTDGKDILVSPQEWFMLIGADSVFSDRLKENIKWSRDPNDVNYLMVYLRYLGLLICSEAAAEGVDTIHINWSYPSAFSEHMKFSLINAFVSLEGWLNSVQKAVSVKVSHKGETESVAVCRYLSSRLINSRAIADIGGGTTDIGVWEKDKLISQTSILLAGSILANYLESNDTLREAILSDLELKDLKEYFATHCSHCLNNILKARSNDLYNLFTVTREMDEEHGFYQARSIIFLVFGGIIYYLGLILESIGSQPVDIVLAGNGSKLINLVGSEAIPKLKLFLPEDLGGTIDIIAVNPKHAKQEVVRGLLGGLHFNTKVPPRIIIGEDGYKVREEEVSFGENITIEKIMAEEIEAPESFSRLIRFLDIYNKCTEALGLQALDILDMNLAKGLKSYIDGRIAYFRHQAYDDIKEGRPYHELIQPPFIEELKYVIGLVFGINLLKD